MLPPHIHKRNRNNTVCLSIVLFSIHPTARTHKLSTSHVKGEGKNELGKLTVVCYCPRLAQQNDHMTRADASLPLFFASWDDREEYFLGVTTYITSDA